SMMIPDPQSLSSAPEPAADQAKPKRRHRCSICDREFAGPSRLADHVATHYGYKPHSCSICGKRFTKKVNVLVHQREEASLRCLLCQEDFSSIKEAKEHEQRHHTTSRFACDICGRAFTRSSQLKDHMRSHTGERPFQCDVCKTRFTLLRALRKHQKIHSRQESRAHTTPGGGPERPATEPVGLPDVTGSSE
ncbi:hypothetical protein GOODEAATRI_030843, partial [Goodea atripinnis]